jgi:hypothetical protein
MEVRLPNLPEETEPSLSIGLPYPLETNLTKAEENASKKKELSLANSKTSAKVSGKLLPVGTLQP